MAKKILIVDDDPDFVEMNRAVLVAGGYEVISAGRAKDGIKMIKEESPDLLLLDVMMGSDVEGFDAVEEIRALPGGRELPIIMITSFDKHHKTAWADKPDKAWVDVERYLNKPVSPEDLLSEVKEALK